MNKTLIVSLACLAALAGAPSIVRAAPDAPPPAASAGTLSVNTTKIGELMANPAAKAVLEKEIPVIDDYFDQIKDMTLVEVAPRSGGKIDDARLKSIQAQLDAIKPGATGGQ